MLGLVDITLGGALDTALSHAILRAVDRGRLGPTFRIHPTTRVVAFGRHDTLAPGYRRAVAAALQAGYEPVERLAGGRAAVFHEGTLAFAWAIPSDDPRRGVHQRFELLSRLMVEAFSTLGLDARVGEVPGEYCPGRYSVNLHGSFKVMGVGQRLVRRAAHVGGVVVVSGADEIRRVLVPVYDALGLTWNPSTAGDLSSARPGISLQEVASAIRSALEERFDVVPVDLPEELLDEARRLAPSHICTA